MGDPSANKQLLRRLHTEVVEARDLDALGAFFAPGFVSHDVPPGMPSGVDGVRAFFAAFRDGLSELDVAVDLVIAEDDLVAVRTTTSGTHTGELLGLPASGRRVEVTGIDLVRIEDGLIAEHWGLTDTVGLLRQVSG
jgi:steroid delta-isomerase-like uncharacterized protein